MKKLGSGLQYAAYDLGKGRIYKKALSIAQQERVLKSWNFKTKASINKKIKEINQIQAECNRKIRQMLENKKIPASLLGNPVFKHGDNYTQDKALPLGKYIAKHSLKENKIVIDGYIKLTHQLWRYGVHDLIFNFTVNNGLTKDGTVIQSDFGECSFRKSELKNHIQRKMWLLKESYKYLSGNPIRPYIAKRLNKEFTLEKMNRLWKSGLK